MYAGVPPPVIQSSPTFATTSTAMYGALPVSSSRQRDTIPCPRPHFCRLFPKSGLNRLIPFSPGLIVWYVLCRITLPNYFLSIVLGFAISIAASHRARFSDCGRWVRWSLVPLSWNGLLLVCCTALD
jgi:hypothetical protein